MATIKTLYGTQGVTITCTLTSLASGSAQEATAIDNTTNLYLDAFVMVKTKTGAGSIGNDAYLYVYVVGTTDGGTTWPDPITGSDAAITLTSNTKAVLLGAVNLAAASTAYKAGPWSVAAAFGGVLPQKWSLAFLNNCGVALSSTAGDHAVTYQGIQAQTV